VPVKPGHGDHDSSRTRDADPTTLDINPGGELDRVATDVGRGPEVESRRKGRSRPKRARSSKAAPDRKGADAPSPATLDPTGDEDLIRLADQIRSSVAGLGDLLMEAWQRKVRLGELLAEARDRCKSRKGAWTTFLEACQVNERTAREAIQFYNRRGEIEELSRHGGAALTVTAAREQLSTPNRKVEPRRRRKPVNDDRGDPAPGALTSHPLPTVRGGSPGGDVEGAAPRGQTAADDHGQATQGSADLPTAADPVPTDPGVTAVPANMPEGAPDQESEEFAIHELADTFIIWVDRAIAKMTPDPYDPVFEDLRRAAPLMRDALRRIEAAVEAHAASRA
jgi:hypothetical protein